MIEHVSINGRKVGYGQPTYIVAELSANHNQSYDEAVHLIKAAKAAGADAVKLQTYTADTITLDCSNEYFMLGGGTIWAGRNLHDLYKEAYTPWDWQPKLMKVARQEGITLFSTPFDDTAVDFLEEMNVPAYKIASFEIVDHGLLKKIASTGKPVILSTGMATFAEVDEAVSVLLANGCEDIVLLKCTSEYPAPPEDMHLRSMSLLGRAYGVPVGLSDHSLGSAVAVAAVALGACMVEKHFTLSRSVPGPDSSFSMEPEEWRRMVADIRTAEKALGCEALPSREAEGANRLNRRSLFIVEDVKEGEVFTSKNVRSIRPGYGLPPKFLGEILGRRAAKDIQRGTPLSWGLLK